MICCARVVLPAPGAPAMTLKENSGRPPPRIWSSPGTPVGSWRIATGSVMPLCLLVAPVGKGIGPRFSQQARCQGFPDEHHEQPHERAEDRSGGFGGDRRILLPQTDDDLGKRFLRLLGLARVG